MYTIIMNPISGNGKSLRVLPEIEKVMNEFSLPYRVLRTQKAGDATLFARDAADARNDGIVVVGGDGTVFEALNGMIGSAMALLFAPCGTGNDFVKAMHIPVDAPAALRMQLSAPLRRLDYGMVNGDAFMNVCGAGFDVEVLRKLVNYKTRYQGLKAYLLALKDALREYKPLSCEVSIDDGAYEKKSLCILSVGNGQYIGGGMKAVPDAMAYDGMLDAVLVRAIPKWKVPFLLPLFIMGKHTRLRISTTYRCKRISLRAPGMTFQMDGELRRMDEANIKIVPGGLSARY